MMASVRRRRKVLVTGGTRGIGAAVADRLRTDGHEVAAVGRAQLDVTDEAAVRAYVAEHGAADVLVASAGVAESAPVGATTLQMWREHMEVNATGVFLCAREVLPAMVERGWGRIVVIASTQGLAGARYTASYAASKHAAVGLVRAIAAEVVGTGVTVNAVCPTFVRTELTARAVAKIGERTGATPAEAVDRLASLAPLGRLLEPDEVAAAVGYLVSDDAAAVNGQSLVLDGGGVQVG